MNTYSPVAFDQQGGLVSMRSSNSTGLCVWEESSNEASYKEIGSMAIPASRVYQYFFFTIIPDFYMVCTFDENK